MIIFIGMIFLATTKIIKGALFVISHANNLLGLCGKRLMRVE